MQAALGEPLLPSVPTMEACEIMYLPEKIRGVQIVFPTKDDSWYLISDSVLKCGLPYPSYRRSRDMNDFWQHNFGKESQDMNNIEHKFGNTVQGTLQQGWLEVKVQVLFTKQEPIGGSSADAFFVISPPGGTNKWGVKNPVGHALEFEYAPPAGMGIGHIKEAQTGMKVCSIRTGKESACAHQIPQMFNMAAKNQREYSSYLERTMDVAFDQTAKLATDLQDVRQQVDLVSKGADGDGFQQVKQRSDRLGVELSALEGTKQVMSTSLQELGQNVGTLQGTISELKQSLDKEKSLLQEAKGKGFVQKSDLAEMQSKYDADLAEMQTWRNQLEKGQQKHEEELKKKCECALQ